MRRSILLTISAAAAIGLGACGGAPANNTTNNANVNKPMNASPAAGLPTPQATPPANANEGNMAPAAANKMSDSKMDKGLPTPPTANKPAAGLPTPQATPHK